MRCKMKKIYICIIVNLISISAYSNVDAEYCEQLNNRLSDLSIQEKLLSWVDNRFDKSMIKLSQTAAFRAPIRPGWVTWKENDFDWKMLGFNPIKGKINLIGLTFRSFVEYPDETNKSFEDRIKYASSNDISSIFFAERTGYGILVKLKSSHEFIDEKYNEYITLVNSRIGVLCGGNIRHD